MNKKILILLLVMSLVMISQVSALVKTNNIGNILLNEGESSTLKINEYHALSGSGYNNLELRFTNPDNNQLVIMTSPILQSIQGIANPNNIHCNNKFCVYIISPTQITFIAKEPSVVSFQMIVSNNFQSNSQNFGLWILEPEVVTPYTPVPKGIASFPDLYVSQFDGVTYDMKNFFSFDDYIQVTYPDAVTGQNVFIDNQNGINSVINDKFKITLYRNQGRSFLYLEPQVTNFSTNITISAFNNAGKSSSSVLRVFGTQTPFIDTHNFSTSLNVNQIQPFPLVTYSKVDESDFTIQRFYLKDYVQGNYNEVTIDVSKPTQFSGGVSSTTLNTSGSSVTINDTNYFLTLFYSQQFGFYFTLRGKTSTNTDNNNFNDNLIKNVIINVNVKNSNSSETYTIKTEPLEGEVLPAIVNTGMFAFYSQTEPIIESPDVNRTLITTFNNTYFVVWNDFYDNFNYIDVGINYVPNDDASFWQSFGGYSASDLVPFVIFEGLTYQVIADTNAGETPLTHPNKFLLTMEGVSIGNLPKDNLEVCWGRIGVSETPFVPFYSESYSFGNPQSFGSDYVIGETFENENFSITMIYGNELFGSIIRTKNTETIKNLSVTAYRYDLSHTIQTHTGGSNVGEPCHFTTPSVASVLATDTFTLEILEVLAGSVNLSRNQEVTLDIKDYIEINTKANNLFANLVPDDGVTYNILTIGDYQTNISITLFYERNNLIHTRKLFPTGDLNNFDKNDVFYEDEDIKITLQNNEVLQPQLKIRSKNKQFNTSVFIEFDNGGGDITRREIQFFIQGGEIITQPSAIGTDGLSSDNTPEFLENIPESQRVILSILLIIALVVGTLMIPGLDGNARVFGAGAIMVGAMVMFAYIGWLPVWIPVVVGVFSVLLLVRSFRSE